MVTSSLSNDSSLILTTKYKEVVSLSEWLKSSNPVADASLFDRGVSSAVEQLTADQ
ncbi:hypothetical protein H8356DRAFT_1326909 [Neocallimastix lanati (nom. inval.)]|nr:hypothetical protein H8356DRAFT_1326909 [Neocallimastix sp. JGI-2020a]